MFWVSHPDITTIINQKAQHILLSLTLVASWVMVYNGKATIVIVPQLQDEQVHC